MPPISTSSRRQRALVPVLVSLGMLVAIISSLGAPLIPTIADVDHVSVSGAQWSLTVTMLVGAVATPAMGRLGDGPHRRKVILTGLVVVLLGSLLAALPLGFACLIVGRALQGAGMGLVPLAIATARDSLPPERARSALATLSLTTAAGVGLGYPVTGLLAEYLGMYAGFWFAAIATALALVAAVLVIPVPPSRPARPMDIPGAVLLALGMSGLLFTLSQGEHWGWGSARLLVLVAVSVFLLGGWVLHELRTEHPLVELRLVRDRVVLAAHLTTLMGGVGMYLLISSVTRYVQTPTDAGYGFGASIVVTGLVLVPFSVASLVAGRVVRLLARTQPLARLLPLSCVISLVSMLTFVFARGALWGVFVTMAVAGLGVGFNFAITPGLIVGGVPAHETGSAMSFNQVVKYIGYSAGSALSAMVLQAATAPGRSLPSGDGYRTTGLLGSGVWAATAVVGLILLRSFARTPSRTAGSTVAMSPAVGTGGPGTSSGSDGSGTSSGPGGSDGSDGSGASDSSDGSVSGRNPGPGATAETRAEVER
ncbi:MFS transporter [Streptomyces sp. NPDC014734]|uniref:MFS transporter n=1 Tax=Streptomyces sp. NPDC014734 TaxID=3364886 RepID=UPI0036FB9443